jgi:hypothetical protein
MAFPTWAKWALGIGGAVGGGFILYKLVKSKTAGAETIVPDQTSTEKIADTLFPGATADEVKEAVDEMVAQDQVPIEDQIREEANGGGGNGGGNGGNGGGATSTLTTTTGASRGFRTPTRDVTASPMTFSRQRPTSTAKTPTTTQSGSATQVGAGTAMQVAGFGILSRSRIRNAMRRGY